MRVLHLTTGLSKQSAAYRLHKGLLKNGIDSFVYAGLRSFNEDRIFYNRGVIKLKLLGFIERQLLKFYPNRVEAPWNIGIFNNTVTEIISELKPDIIHCHWVNQFVSIKKIANFNIPVVWTLHDSWAFTGGCHIPFLCEKYKRKCEACPQLKSKFSLDLSTYIFNLKRKSWKKANIHFVGPSKWMAGNAKCSALLGGFPVVHVPNCIDTDYFSTKDKIEARNIFDIPLEKKVILFGANNAMHDYNKGFDLLEQAYELLKKIKDLDNVELVVFGTKDKGYCSESRIRKLGFLEDPDSFPLIYSAADVVVNVSRSENFSNVILESLSCGTPVVAFNIGGNSDLIKTGINGELVKPFDVVELSFVLSKFLREPRKNAEGVAKSISQYSENVISKKFDELYKGIIER